MGRFPKRDFVRGKKEGSGEFEEGLFLRLSNR